MYAGWSRSLPYISSPWYMFVSGSVVISILCHLTGFVIPYACGSMVIGQLISLSEAGSIDEDNDDPLNDDTGVFKNQKTADGDKPPRSSTTGRVIRFQMKTVGWPAKVTWNRVKAHIQEKLPDVKVQEISWGKKPHHAEVYLKRSDYSWDTVDATDEIALPFKAIKFMKKYGHALLAVVSNEEQSRAVLFDPESQLQRHSHVASMEEILAWRDEQSHKNNGTAQTLLITNFPEENHQAGVRASTHSPLPSPNLSPLQPQQRQQHGGRGSLSSLVPHDRSSFDCVVAWDDLKLYTRSNSGKTREFALPTASLLRGCALATDRSANCYDGNWDEDGMLAFIKADLQMWYHFDPNFFGLFLATTVVGLGLETSIFCVGLLAAAMAMRVLWGKVPEFPQGRGTLGSAMQSTPVRLLMKADRKFVDTCKEATHSLVSIFLILGLLVAAIGGSVLIGVRVQQESSVIVRAVSSGTYRVFQDGEFLAGYLPPQEDIKSFVNSTRNQVREYARDYAGTKGKEYLGPTFNVTEFELGLERIMIQYNANSTANVTANVTAAALEQCSNADDVCAADTISSRTLSRPTWELGVEQLIQGEFSDAYASFFPNSDTSSDNAQAVVNPLSNLDYYAIMTQAQGYAQHGAAILVANVQLATGVAGSLVGTVLGEFFNVLDFLATFGLFVSTLFYLLRASNAAGEYLPIQIIKLALPNEMEGRAVSEMYKSIDGVFLSTFKMAFFHGLYMWLTLTLYHADIGGIEIVAIPSIASAVLAVVPIFPSFVLAVPTCIGLYLSDSGRDEGLGYGPGYLDSVSFFFLHFYVYWEVSPAIYENMTEDLPYLFVSLSVVGGMVAMGIEGAILGPLALAGFTSSIRIVAMLSHVTDTATNQKETLGASVLYDDDPLVRASHISGMGLTIFDSTARGYTNGVGTGGADTVGPMDMSTSPTLRHTEHRPVASRTSRVRLSSQDIVNLSPPPDNGIFPEAAAGGVPQEGARDKDRFAAVSVFPASVPGIPAPALAASTLRWTSRSPRKNIII